MAEFLTQDDADKRYGKKSRTNAGLTLGIIGTALAAFNNGGNDGCFCGGGNNGGGGILGGLFGNRGGGGCCCAMNAAQQAKTMAMLQGQQADNLAWANRVASIEDTAALASNLEPRLTRMNNQDWENRVASMRDDADVYSAARNGIDAVANKLSNETQALTNQIWKGRVEDLQEKFDIYARGVARDNEITSSICQLENKENEDKFNLYQTLNAQNQKQDRFSYENRVTDLNEKFDLYTRLNNKITDLEKAQAKTETALPLLFELNKVNSERYTDACCCKSEKNLLMLDNSLQRQIDRKIDGQLKYEYSNLCAPVPSISPLYCSPFTTYGSGTTWSGCCQNTGCQSL